MTDVTVGKFKRNNLQRTCVGSRMLNLCVSLSEENDRLIAAIERARGLINSCPIEAELILLRALKPRGE